MAQQNNQYGSYVFGGALFTFKLNEHYRESTVTATAPSTPVASEIKMFIIFMLLSNCCGHETLRHHYPSYYIRRLFKRRLTRSSADSVASRFTCRRCYNTSSVRPDRLIYGAVIYDFKVPLAIVSFHCSPYTQTFLITWVDYTPAVSRRVYVN